MSSLGRINPGPMLNITLSGPPHSVEMLRSSEVPDDLWYAIALYLGVSTSPNTKERLRIPVERFLASRSWLQQQCQDHQVGVNVATSIKEVLSRARIEREHVEAVLQNAKGTDGPVAPPEIRERRFVRELRGFQQRDLDRLIALRNGANFSVPGAGKTTVTYALYDVERCRGSVDQLLVVAPLSAFDSWETEARQCFDRPIKTARFDGHIPLDAEVVLINYQRLSPYYERIASWVSQSSTHVVLDEAHRAKAGRGGEWGSACLDLAYLAVRRDILTGTPAPQGPRDFIALMEFLWPGQGNRIVPAQALVSNPTKNSMHVLSNMLQPLFVRTRKGELGLDPPLRQVKTVTLTGLQAEIYDALRDRYAGMFDLSRSDRTLLAQMGQVSIYLLQAATNPALLARRVGGESADELRFPSIEIPQHSRLADLISNYARHEVPPKFGVLLSMLEENAQNSKKTLVWSNFPGNLQILEKTLSRYQPALVYGGVPLESDRQSPDARTRERELERFRTDPECLVLLANPAATAEGISLHDVCHDAIYLDRTFNAGQYLQSLDRIHRLGLARGTETRITFLITKRTVDEVVDARVAAKAERLAEMLDDPDLLTLALPDDEDYGEIIESEDLAALFEHLKGDDGGD